MNKAVVLDLDGTLMETIEDIRCALNIMLKKFGYPEITSERARQIINHGAKELVKNAIPEKLSQEKFNECYDEYKKIYFDLDCKKTYVYQGMQEFITACKNAGYKVCIATNKHVSKTKSLCEEKLPDFKFDAILGIDEGVIPKPDPTYTLKMLESLDVNPQDAYFIGDGDTDVVTSLRAGTKGISVLWGYRNQSQLSKVGAKIFAQTPADLLNLIKL
ncbi:MAG: HAD family hydrolase [Clostridia bacterium]|nr:HAD family hydrolase [Clostridia bacterium]